MARTPVAFAAVMLLVVVACGGEQTGATGSPDPASSPVSVTPTPSPSPRPVSGIEPEDELCLLVAEFDERLAALQAVELTLPNRVALDIELDELMTAYGDLEEAEMGELEDELEGSLTRLGYRLGELELAVEDFRTNSRPRRAAPHVEEDAQKVADELGAFVILSRCR